MAILYISESEAVRDFASVLAKVRAGSEVVIEDGNATVALLLPAASESRDMEPGYDEWLQSELQQSLANDPAKRISEEQADAIMAERRRAALQKLQGSAA